MIRMWIGIGVVAMKTWLPMGLIVDRRRKKWRLKK